MNTTSEATPYSSTAGTAPSPVSISMIGEVSELQARLLDSNQRFCAVIGAVRDGMLSLDQSLPPLPEPANSAPGDAKQPGDPGHLKMVQFQAEMFRKNVLELEHIAKHFCNYSVD